MLFSYWSPTEVALLKSVFVWSHQKSLLLKNKGTRIRVSGKYNCQGEMKVLDSPNSKSLTRCYERVERERETVTFQAGYKCKNTTVLFENTKSQMANSY